MTETFQIKPVGYETIHKIKTKMIAAINSIRGLLWVIFGPGPIIGRHR